MTIDRHARGEMHNLRSDPEERHDLFHDGEQLPPIQDLLKKIHGWQRQTEDAPIRFNAGEWRRKSVRRRREAA